MDTVPTLFVGRIPPIMHDDLMIRLLNCCGQIRQWRRSFDQTTRKPTAFGFCDFMSPNSLLIAQDVLGSLDLTVVRGAQHSQLVLTMDDRVSGFIQNYRARRVVEERAKIADVAISQGRPLEPTVLDMKAEEAMRAIIADMAQEAKAKLKDIWDNALKTISGQNAINMLPLTKRFQQNNDDPQALNDTQTNMASLAIAAGVQNSVGLSRDEIYFIERKKQYDIMERSRIQYYTMRLNEPLLPVASKRVRVLSRAEREDETERDRIDREEEAREIRHRRRKEKREAKRKEKEERRSRRHHKSHERKGSESEGEGEGEPQPENVPEAAEEDQTMRDEDAGPVTMSFGNAESVPARSVAREFNAAEEVRGSQAFGIERRETGVSWEEHRKAMVEKVPKTKEEMFAFPIPWDTVEENNLVNTIVAPWVNQKVVEMLGQQNSALVNLICTHVADKESPEKLVEKLNPILGRDSEALVVRLWRRLIFESLCAQKP